MIWTGSLFTIFLTSATWASVPQVKVLIGKSLKDVVVTGTDLRQSIPSRKLFRQFDGAQTVNFNCRLKSSATLPDKNQLVASVTSPTGLVGWEDKKFRGELHLVAGPNAQKDGCSLVNLISMEHYLSSLLAKEMRSDWPIEALKAQAVVARSYALAKMQPQLNSGVWHLESSEKDQVSGSFHDTTARTDLATKQTEGEILVDQNNRAVMGFFHSKCGGHTFRPEQIWSNQVEGYKQVQCPFCHKHGKKAWKNQMKKSQLASLLGRTLTRYGEEPVQFSADQLTFVTDQPLKSEIRFYHGNKLHTVKKSWLRNIAGRELLPSTNFQMNSSSDTIKVSGQGFGHGVGMCQLGAFELAQRGYGYKEILQHYFPNLKVSRNW